MSASGGETSNIFLKSPALTREINRIGYAAMDIRTAIANKGVSVPSNAKIEDYADLIDSIALDMSNTKLATSTFTTLPSLIANADWSQVTNAAGMFNYCSSLTTVPELNLSNVTNLTQMFRYCFALTTLGGFKNLGQAYLTSESSNYSEYKLDLSSCTQLTHDSLMNVIDKLYDIAIKGCNTQQLVLGSTNLAKLSAEEISTCTSKGWSLS